MAELTESSIVIDAPGDQVLAAIADVGSYPKWAAGVEHCEVLHTTPGAGGVHRPAKARFVLSDGPLRDTYTLEYDWSEAPAHAAMPRVVSWSLLEGQVIKRLDGSYQVYDRGGASEVVYRLTVEVKIPMLGMLRRKAERAIVTTALQDLKTRVEG